MARIISIETLKAQQAAAARKYPVSFRVNGEMKSVDIDIAVGGEMTTYDFDLSQYRPTDPSRSALGEMLTTPSGLYNAVQKSIVDMQLGRESLPLLYLPLYQTVTDANFSEFVEVAPFVNASVAFLQHLEMEEVTMGHRTIGPKDTVPIITWAGGFEWTEDMVQYDKTWEITQLNRGMGEGYNAMLNHTHLYPILSYQYAAKNKTGAVTTDEAGTEFPTMRERVRATLRKALVHQSQDRNTDTLAPRRGSVLLIHSSRLLDIEDALGEFQVGGTKYTALRGINTIIVYDGHAFKVGDKTYTYGGCPTDKAYLIEPKRYFMELVKHDLLVDAQGGDLKRLIEQVMVGRCRRGVIASPANAVEEITLPE